MNATNVYRDYTVMCPEFREGIGYLAEGDLEKALDAFAIADHKTSRDDVNKNKYQSFHGLMLVYAGQSKGIELCRAASASECFDGDVFYNQARAELDLEHRRQAVVALRRGLEFDRTHPDLLRLRQRLGIRRGLMIPFLDRDNMFNKLLGKISYQRLQLI
ncbi:MAG: hypothetical protein KAT25_04630 [Sulfuriflexus sp.]|nr:hypothetical protein [Sulfuriflexus sp.]